GSAAAGLARSPWTQLEIYPFRGIKIAFLLTWIGALFVLYRPAEISEFLQRALRRIDVVAGIAILALVGYVVIRSGNASAAWKGPWEQVLRDHLENWLLVRPRFKEFAFGHPLMLFGLSRVLHRVRPKGAFDGRAWIWLGMIGQASVINTFCHLHSPIKLAYARSIIGMVIGAILGGLLIRLMNVDWLSRFRPDVLRLRSSQKPL